MTTLETQAGAPPGTDPAFVIDAYRSRLMEANGPGRAFWNLDPAPDENGPPTGGKALPLDLDAAMPALQSLRSTPTDDPMAQPRTLTFWMGHAARSVECRVRRLPDRADSPFQIEVMGPAASVDASRGGANFPDLPAATGPVAVDASAVDVSRETIARLGHELRTPMAAILSLADVMAKGHFGPLGSARYEDYARSIRETARHALGVIGSMLESDAMGRPIAEQTFTEVDLNDVVADAVRSVEPMAEDIGVSLDLTLAPRLPRLIVDRLAVQQIVLNLLTNGFTHVGAGARLHLRTGGTIGGETWFEAEDDGPGIPASVIQSVTTGTAVAGLGAFSSTPEGGLGLRLVRALAEANGGRLEITGVNPHGARVRIAFNASRALPV